MAYPKMEVLSDADGVLDGVIHKFKEAETEFLQAIRGSVTLAQDNLELEEKIKDLCARRDELSKQLVKARSDKRWAMVTAIIFGVAFLIGTIYG